MLSYQRLSTLMLTAVAAANFAETFLLTPIQMQKPASDRNYTGKDYLLLKYGNLKIIDENGRELPNPYRRKIKTDGNQGVMSGPEQSPVANEGSTFEPNFQKLEKSAVKKRIGLGNSQGERCSQDDLPYADETNPKFYYTCTKQGKRGYFYIKSRCSKGEFDNDEGFCVWPSTGKVPYQPSRSFNEKIKSHQR